MPHVALGQQSLYYELAPNTRAKDAPYLVLSNSLGADLTMWVAQLPSFTQSFHVLRYDPRGHGRSALAAQPFTMADLASDVLGLLDHLRIARAHVCGLSMGGQVAQWLAIHAPLRVDRLVICNSAALIGSNESWNARINGVRGGGMAAIGEVVIGRWFTPRFRAASPRTVETMKQVLLATEPEGYAAACAAIRDSDLREQVASIGARTLVVSGTHDQATPLQDAYFLSEHLPRSHYVELDAAHISNVEQAGQFTSAVHGFLTGSD